MEVDRASQEVEVDHIREGDWVLVVDNEVRFSFALARKESTIRLGKKTCGCGPFVGAPWGCYFEAINGKLIRTNPRAHTEALEDLVGDESTGTAAYDNRDLKDENKSQGLTIEEIQAMKDEGKKGELVRALAANSATFAKRTEFSQEKYLKKKTAKHQVIIQVVKPTSALISKAYFTKKSYRVQNMRPDALAHISTLANLQSGTRSLIIDDCIGLIVGLALERAGGRGAVYNLHQGGDSNPSALRLFNFSHEQLQPLKHVPIALMRGTLTAQSLNVDENDENTTSNATDMDVDDLDTTNTGKQQKLNRRINPSELPPKKKKKDYVPLAKVREAEEAEGITPEESAERRKQNAEMRKKYRELKWQTLCDYKMELETRGVDALIIAGPAHPLNALNSTFRFLSLSGAFVVYSEFLHPLIECFEALHQTGEVINMRLTETWHRHYQVLPKRTHPLMNMSAASGYLLTGIKVEPPRVFEPVASSSTSTSDPPAKRAKTS